MKATKNDSNVRKTCTQNCREENKLGCLGSETYINNLSPLPPIGHFEYILQIFKQRLQLLPKT